jgi:hypothetical protein
MGETRSALLGPTIESSYLLNGYLAGQHEANSGKWLFNKKR